MIESREAVKKNTIHTRRQINIHRKVDKTDWSLQYALAKRTRKSMQVDASLQNQSLRTDLRWVAKRIRKSARKFTQVAKSSKFHT